MNIREFIKVLNNIDDNTIIRGIDINNSGSDRGNYYDFCLSISRKQLTVHELKHFILNNVIGKEFIGYKERYFKMDYDSIIKFGYPDCGGENIVGLIVDERGFNILTK